MAHEEKKYLVYTNTDFFQYPISKHPEEQKDHPSTESRRNTEYLVEFMTQSHRYVVGMVDMVNSSKISAQIGPIKSARYYQIFLNSMSKILCRYGGTVIKNTGDCLFYYFPESDKLNKTGFTNCIECSLEMTRSQKYLSEQLVSEGLPIVDFRVSADFGTVLLMRTSITDSLDLIGPPVNMCSKINKTAAKNQFVIGGDLFEIVKEFKAYRFKEISDFSLGFKLCYPIYLVSDK